MATSERLAIDRVTEVAASDELDQHLPLIHWYAAEVRTRHHRMWSWPFIGSQASPTQQDLLLVAKLLALRLRSWGWLPDGASEVAAENSLSLFITFNGYARDLSPAPAE